MTGFTQIPNEIFDDYPYLSPGEKFLYSLLLRHDGKLGAFPSQVLLAKKAGKSERYIRMMLRKLSLAGLIEKKRRGYNKTNLYTLTLKVDRKPVSSHFGNPVPHSRGNGVPHNNMYIKRKNNKNIESIKDILSRRIR